MTKPKFQQADINSLRKTIEALTNENIQLLARIEQLNDEITSHNNCRKHYNVLIGEKDQQLEELHQKHRSLEEKHLELMEEKKASDTSLNNAKNKLQEELNEKVKLFSEISYLEEKNKQLISGTQNNTQKYQPS